MGLVWAKLDEEKGEYRQSLARGLRLLETSLPEYIKDKELVGLTARDEGKTSSWDDFQVAAEHEDILDDDDLAGAPETFAEQELRRRAQEAFVEDHRVFFEAAATGKRAQVTAALIRGTVNINAVDIYGRSALYLAAERGHSKVVASFVASRGNRLKRVCNKDGWSPLHAATFHGHLKCMRILLESQGDANLQDNHGCTPLTFAVSSPKLYLLDLVAKKDRQKNKKYRQDAFRQQLQELESLEQGAGGISGVLKTVPPHELWRYFPNQVQLIVLQELKANAGSKLEIDTTDKLRRTPLMYAARYGRTYAVSWLLHAKANHRLVDRDGRGPLMLAASNDHFETAELLLRARAAVHVEDQMLRTPLHGALESGNEPITRLLLNAEANVNSWDCEGRTPLLLAMDKGSVRLFVELVQRKSSLDIVDKRGWNVVIYAVETNMLTQISPLLQKLGDKAHKILRAQDPQGRNALAHAVQLSNIASATTAVQLLAMIDPESATHGDCNGDTPIHMAAELGRLEILRNLLQGQESGDRVNEHLETPLHHAARAGHLACFVALVSDRGKGKGPLCDAEAKDSWQRGVLHHTCASGHLDLVNLILSNKKGRSKDLRLPRIDVNAMDKTGATPLIIAAREGHWQLLPSLVLAGACLSDKDKDGWSAAHWAASECEDLALSCLLDLEADPNITDVKGWTPLMYAAVAGADEAVRVLVDSGKADLHVRNWDGDTALQLCKRRKDAPELVRTTCGILLDAVIHDAPQDVKIDAKGYFIVSVLSALDLYMEGKVGELNTYVCLQFRTHRSAAPFVAFTSCVLSSPSPEWHETFRFDVEGIDSTAVLVAWVVSAPGDDADQVIEGTEFGLTEEELREIADQRIMNPQAMPARTRKPPDFGSALSTNFGRATRKADRSADKEVLRMRKNALAQSRGAEPTTDLANPAARESSDYAARRWQDVENLRTVLERSGCEAHLPMVPKSHIVVGCVVVRFRQLRTAVWQTQVVDVGRTLRLNCRGMLNMEVDFRPRFFEPKPDPRASSLTPEEEDELYALRPFDITHESAEKILGKLPEKPPAKKRGRRGASEPPKAGRARPGLSGSAPSARQRAGSLG